MRKDACYRRPRREDRVHRKGCIWLSKATWVNFTAKCCKPDKSWPALQTQTLWLLYPARTLERVATVLTYATSLFSMGLLMARRLFSARLPRLWNFGV